MIDGLKGVVAAETVLSHSDGETGTIWLRGHTVQELVEKHGYEGAVAIIWEGFVGDGLTRDTVLRDFGAGRERAFARLGEWFGAAEERPIVEGLRIALAALPERTAPVDIAATFQVAVPALIRTRDGKPLLAPDASLGVAADVLRMMKGTPASAAEVRALDCYFTCMSENGLGASGFAGRVAISTKSSLASAVLAAYCTFTGPLHGGAPGPVLDMLDEIEASGDIEGWIEKKLASGGRLMGFGHRIFRVEDARVPILRAAVAGLHKDSDRIAFANKVEQAALAALRRHKPGMALPNIEMNAALLLEAVGVPRDAFTQVFATARSVGWIAHALEQLKTGRMIRPVSHYIGPKPAI
jgi:citrate synthase